MLAILHSVGMFVADLFKSRCRLEAENLFLRHQLSIALRRAPPRLRLRGRTCGEFLLRMQRITITRARTWRWARMRPWVGRSSGPVSFRYPNLGRAAPPIRPDMIFGKDRGMEVLQNDRYGSRRNPSMGSLN